MISRLKKRPYIGVCAKILVFCMILQGMPVAQLAEAAEWRFDTPRIVTKLLDLLGPSSAEAAAPRVTCVPQLPADPLVPHETWSGEPAVLKGVARDDDGNLSGGTYYWELGDGTSTSPASISNADNLSATHSYAAAPGSLFVARLHVTDAAGESSSDEYRVLVKARTLDTEVNKAIDDGLWWLYLNRQDMGAAGCRWTHSSSYVANSTASAVQSFEINGYLETGDPEENPYAEAVRGGIDYLTTRINSYNIGNQTYGNPDANGNGIGLTVSGGRQIYELGAVMDALVATGTPDATARQGGTNVVGRRYRDIVQDMCDMYAWGQYDHSSVGGGWRYSWNQWPDNSAAQWGAIGLIAAERHFGCVVPQWVKDRNNVWLNYSYNGTGFGYTGRGNGWATTPSGMIQLAFDGFETSDSRWRTAENWLAGRWDSFADNYYGRNYYSYYAFAKAMRLALPQEVVNLYNGIDWYGDENRGMARKLVDRQNDNGSWRSGQYVSTSLATAWSVIILTRTLFEKPPVAVATAEPNPGAAGQLISLDGSGSYHVDPAKTVAEYYWDFDASDGVDFDFPDATGPSAETVYGALGDYVVTLKVVDDSTPRRFDTTTVAVEITIPPHPPTAVTGGPYLATVGEPILLDGSGSYDVDEPDGDSITAWDWEIDFVAPYDFGEASGEIVEVPGFDRAGHRDIALRATDDTAAAFPQAGSPDLTNSAFGIVNVFDVGVYDLAARPKATKCQLTWTHIDADVYEVLRSETGPSRGYVTIGTTGSTYSTFIDYNVVMEKDYWYRVRCEIGGETLLSGPVHVNSRGRIRNLPPEITSAPVVEAHEGQLYSYDLEAVDPEGAALAYYLEQAPDGMDIDPATGLIQWTPTFADAGIVEIFVRVDDARLASASQYYQITVTPRPNTAPTVDPGGPYEGMTETAVAFDGSGTIDPEGDAIALYHWAFGDGQEGYGEQVEHVYAAAGTYTVTLYATDDRGATASAETVCQIEAPNSPPVAAITGLDTGEAGVPMAFDALSSGDPDGDPLTFVWNFGDSTPAETGETVLHAYDAPGTYMVTLSADDGRGGLDSAELEVTVDPANLPPEASFAVSGEQTRLETLTFDASASSDPEGSPLASYEWDFGDGSATTGRIVTHVFQSVDTFVVTLTVTDDRGLEDSVSQSIAIAEIMVAVPDVAGLPQADAEAAIADAGLTLGTVTEIDSETVPAGSVVSQDPAAGSSAQIGSNVDIVVSLGPPMVAVPDVTGLARAEAESAILAADLTVGDVELQSSSSVPEGAVIAQDPSAGTEIEIRSSVDLVVSIGDHQIVVVPDLVGLSYDDALVAIAAAGLPLGETTEQYSQTAPQGTVISVAPSPGESVIDTTPIDIVVSLGVQMVVVPDVVGQSQADATDLIESAELVVGTVAQRMDLGVPEGQVLDQNPIGGASVPVGNAVDFTVAVHSDVVAPEVSVRFSANPVGPDRFTLIAVAAEDNIGVASVELEVDGAPQTLSVDGQCWYLAGDEGLIEVVARAEDDAGNVGFDTAWLSVSSVEDATAPTVSLEYSPNAPAVGETVVFAVSAEDDSGVDTERIWLKVDGVYVHVQDGRAEYVAKRQGNIPAVASAYDLSGNYAQDTTVLPVSVDGSNVQVPVAVITSPADGEEVFGLVDVIGTADDADLAFYTLSYRAEGETDYVEYHRSEQPVANDVLGPLDGSLLENGLYTVLLTAVDIYGEITADTVQVLVSGKQKLGIFTLSFNDMSLNLSGIDMKIVRTYDSRVKTKRDFGIGWNLDIRQNVKIDETTDPSIGYEIYCASSSFGICFAYGVRATQAHDIVVNIPGAPRQEFRFTPVASYAYAGGLAQGYLRIDPKPGTFSTLEPLDNSHFEFLMGGELLDSAFEPLNPNRYRLTLLDGTQYYYNQSTGKVYRIADANGNQIDISDSGIVHSDGQSIQFNRDSHGRIASVVDPDGRQIVYAYDGLGNLRSATDPNGNTTKFKYARNHYLDEIIDPRGVSGTRTEYDEEGRVIRQINADGGEMALDYDVENGEQTVTDFGGDSTYYTYDEDGNTTSKTDALGNTWTYTYDADGNQTSATDPNGATTQSAYDQYGNLVSFTDENGNTTLKTYTASGKLASETDPLGNTTTYEYDARGNLTGKVGPGGSVLSYSYDAKGNRLTETDALGNTTTYAYSDGKVASVTDALGHTKSFQYDNRGNLLQETDPSGGVTSYSYDANNNKLTETDPNGATTTYTYTSFDKIATKTDKNGNTTGYSYDMFGRMVREDKPDGTSAEYGYDKQGNIESITNAEGETTAFGYDSVSYANNNVFDTLSFGCKQDDDPRCANCESCESCETCDKRFALDEDALESMKRISKIVHADGSRLDIDYDATGNVRSVSDAAGNTTWYEYDNAGRKTKTTDALGHETNFQYDANGNLVFVLDANGNFVEYEYDSQNRRVKTTYTDGTFSQLSYNANGNVISETDQNGVATQYEYDALGRLTAVVDALGGRLEYVYDESGNKTSQTDPNGNTTVWEYDDAGRVVRQTLPLGMSKTFAYDDNGNVLSETDYNGVTVEYSYDAANRLVEKRYPDGSAVSYTYTETGKKETVTDQRGVTQYVYDKDRLIGRTNPDGSFIQYEYDNRGNRTLVSTASGDVTYEYDQLNRLVRTTDPDGAATSYTYDAVGNRASVTLPNGNTTTYEYNSLDRLTGMENRKADGTLVSGYSYTLGPAGNRLSVVEHTGRIVNYTYDTLYRLVKEEILDSINGDETIEYTYDGFGNRITKTDSQGLTVYDYDANDRLLTESVPGSKRFCDYDANGNLLQTDDGTDIVVYVYDYENRLVQVEKNGVITAFEYDHEGNRVFQDIGGQVTEYLVDSNRDHAQVLEERDGICNIVVSYVYGDDLISQDRGAKRFYLYDGQMSVRQLANESGDVTDEYTFDAFGIMLDQAGVSENNYLYTGEQYDPNIGYYYLRARYYDQNTGRFITMDTHKGNVFEPPTLHKYAYGANNPVMHIDPSGRMYFAYALISMQLMRQMMFLMLAMMTVVLMSKYIETVQVNPPPPLGEAKKPQFDLNLCRAMCYGKFSSKPFKLAMCLLLCWVSWIIDLTNNF